MTMASLSFTESIKNFIQTLKKEEMTNSLSASRNDQEHQYRRGTSTTSGKSSYTYGNTQQYSVPVGLSGTKVYSEIKKEIEEIIIIDSDDESECEVKQNGGQNGELEFSSGTKIDNQPFSSHSNNANNVQSISFSMEGKCNFLKTLLIPPVNSNQKLSARNSGVLISTQNDFHLNHSFPTENISNNSDSDCSSKSNDTECEVSSSKQTISPRSFRKLSKKERSCEFCGSRFKALSGLQTHNKFSCSYQTKHTVVCKICGLNCATPCKAKLHIKNNHGMMKVSKLNSLIHVISPENSLTESFFEATTPLLINDLNDIDTLNPSKERSSPTLSKKDFCENLQNSYTKRVKKRLKNFRRFPCRFCKRELISLHTLDVHLKYHCQVQKMNELMCKICGRRYAGRTALVGHLNKIHNMRKIPQELRNFIAIVKKDSNSSKGNADESKSTKQVVSPSSFSNLSRKQRFCMFCRKIFETMTGFQIHNKYHCKFQVKNNFVCKICGLKLTRPDSLVKHVRKKHEINRGRLKQKSLLSKYSVSTANNSMGKSISKAAESSPVTGKVLNYFSKSNFPCTTSNNNEDENLGTSTRGRPKIWYSWSQIAYKGKKFQCNLCKYKCISGSTLYDHMNYCCPFQKRFELKCQICGTKFPSHQSAKCHLRCTHGLPHNKLKSYYLKVKIKSKSKENIRNEYEIDSSSRNYSSRNKISGQQFKCTHCFKSFARKRFLGSHLRFCGNYRKEKVSRNSQMKQKAQIVSEDQDTLGKCGFCNMCFDSPTEIKRHCLTSHNITKIICQSCNEIFISIRTFKMHLTAIDGNYVCGSLQKSGKDFRLGNEEVDGENSDSQKSPISCNVCNEKFGSLVLLVQHLQEHLV